MPPPTESPRTRWPWLVVAGYVPLAVAGNVLEALSGSRLASSEGTPGERAIVSVAFLGVLIAGALITSRRPGAPAGPNLLALGSTWGASLMLTGGGAWALPGHRAAASALLWLAAPSAGVAVFLLGRLAVTFPDRPSSGAFWRRVPRIQTALLAAAAVGTALGPRFLPGGVDGVTNPTALPGSLAPPAAALMAAGLAGLFLLGLAAVCHLWLRARRATGLEREQLRVMRIPATGLLLGLLLLVFGPSGGTDAVAAGVVLLSVLGMALAAAVAILRYRLYAIDVVLERSVAMLALIALATVAYVAAVASVGGVLGSGNLSATSVLASVGAALALLPARAHLERFARRLVHGDRATPYEALSAFTAQLRSALSLDSVLPATAEAVARGLGAEAVAVQVWSASGPGPRAVWPTGHPAPDGRPAIDVVHEGQRVGVVTVGLRRGDRLEPARERLLADLASQAALALHNVRLTADLEDHVRELRASQRRIVTAQDEVRRRVERDLHDGAQQRLVRLAIDLGQAIDRAQGPGQSEQRVALQRAQAELRLVRDELRELALGIHPPVLAEAGLPAAIESLAERAPFPVQVRVPAARLSPVTESTAYFVVAEALTNVAKHACAAGARVVMHLDGPELVLEVSDDGVGGATSGRGSGLQGLQDRVSAAGGEFRVASPTGRGTIVTARLPCASS